MTTESSVTVWLDRLKLGDSLAAQRLWEAYYERLVRVARKQLAHAARRVADEEDVAVAAFHSFYGGVQKGRFPKLDDRHDLWQVLVMIAARKAVDQKQAAGRKKRGGGRVRGESVFDRNDGGPAGIAQIVGREPTPEFALLVAEQLGGMIDRLDDDALRDIALMKLDGYENAEIARRLGCALRTVERKLSRIRAIWNGEET